MFFAKRIATVTLLAAALLGSFTVGALPASATTATPAGVAVVPAAGAVQCDGDLCIQRTSANGVLPATIRAWARTTKFTGHFELIFPDGSVKNSPTQTWAAGGTGHKFTNVPGGPGYGMTAWKGTAHPFTNIGHVGFAV